MLPNCRRASKLFNSTVLDLLAAHGSGSQSSLRMTADVAGHRVENWLVSRIWDGAASLATMLKPVP